MAYKSLNVTGIESYIRDIVFFERHESFHTEEIGDGNLNLVFRVSSKSGKSAIIKQALPYLKVFGDKWPLRLERNKLEAEALKIQNKLAPGLAPKVYLVDEELALTIMEDLSRLGIMRLGTIKMKKYPKFVDHISTFLTNMILYTSDFFMAPLEKKKLVKKFTNPDLCKITEDLIFTDPYYDCPRNNVNPALRPYLESKFWKREYLWREASKLKYNFLTHAESLIHGDLHTGSIFVSETETKVFDAEFACFGPSAFDPGLLIGNILINYVSWDGKDQPLKAIRDYRTYLLNTIEGIYEEFIRKFTEKYKEEVRDISFRNMSYLETYLEEFFLDMIGYAATAMIRRMHGLAHNIDVDGIEDLKRRSEVQISILELATSSMMSRYKFKSIRDVTSYIKSIMF
ncbi:MAG: S-methyl-5-thioribose kinase [Candidatus Aenigmarchaeota archaeon]|nr:S-methyl-5-thioribose kinase [Candidatus Aenigmarchaeota archaeon]